MLISPGREMIFREREGERERKERKERERKSGFYS